MLRAATVALVFPLVASVGRAQQTAIKIAFVNTQALMDAAPGRAAADSALQKTSEGFKAQIQKMQDSLNAMYTDYTKKEPTLTAAQKEARQKSIQAFDTELQAKNLQLQQQFQQKSQELLAPLQETVHKVLDDIRKEDGYAMILANDPGQSSIVSADKNLDITERVVARLRTVAATTKNAPATKPGGVGSPAGVQKPPPKPPTQ